MFVLRVSRLAERNMSYSTPSAQAMQSPQKLREVKADLGTSYNVPMRRTIYSRLLLITRLEFSESVLLIHLKECVSYGFRLLLSHCR